MDRTAPAHAAAPTDRSPESEACALAEVLTDATLFPSARAVVGVLDFFEDRNRALFSALDRLHGTGESLAPDVVLAELRRTGDLERAGGAGRLAELLDFVTTSNPTGLLYHARNVRLCALQRKRADLARAALTEGDPGGLVWRAVIEVQAEIEAIDRPSRERFSFLTDRELEDMPTPEYLIDGILPAGSLAMLWGHPETGKSFVAVDWSLSVATGSAWMNRTVRRGPVVYVVSEGHQGMNKRVRAWKRHHHFFGDAGVLFLPDRIRLTDSAEVALFIAALGKLPAPPALVVVDTLARAMAGADENSTQEAGQAVENADRIRKATGAAVLLLHHPNKGGQEPRGNTSFVGALDTSICLRKAEKRIILDCRKQKDAAPFDAIALRLMPLAESCVLVDNLRARTEWQESGGGLSDSNRRVLECLVTDFLSHEGATYTQWLKASGVPEGSFPRARTELVTMGYVKQDGKHYLASDAARRAVTINYHRPITEVSGSYQNSLSQAPPLEGVPDSDRRRGLEVDDAA
jgi:hypothetical protein